MYRKVPAPVVDERFAQATLERQVETAINLFPPAEPAPESGAVALAPYKPEPQTELFDQVGQLPADSQLALIRGLIAHFDVDQIQSILEFGQREISERQRRASTPTAPVNRETRLLLKKDYTYQDRGLSEPTQYYVYLRRRKPKLDRYIGTLFYIPQGCTLSYVPDAEGRISFNPPHNVFQLRDFKDPSVTQIVRLICLEPPPADYTFSKQQEDAPDIHLRLEYLDAQTYQPIAQESYPFPFCMYEGGKLDRYRWDVSTVQLPEAAAAADSQAVAPDGVRAEPLPAPNRSVQAPLPRQSSASATRASTVSPPHMEMNVSFDAPGELVSKPPRRVIELPATASSTFYLTNRCDASLILERIRLWVAWSEKAMPQSRWEIIQDGTLYTLRNARFKRNILSFSLDHASVTLANSLPVLMKWFHDLGLAVSQSQSQRPYSAAQLKLAHSLFVDMSLPQNDALVVLKKLFNVKFSKTSLYK